ncbi:MAG: ribosomal-processing cysteine protease Prp [Butyrivibrio sp.]|nr:ribosomal-processing cysteine protease Prp [Butyrivibrio sp.]
MTKVTILKDGDGFLGFSMEGHAGSGEYGRDIVCAALSVLAINTVNAIETFTEDELLVESQEKQGILKCRSQGPMSEQATLLMRAFELGVKGVCTEYGRKYVRLSYEEVRR